MNGTIIHFRFVKVKMVEKNLKVL